MPVKVQVSKSTVWDEIRSAYNAEFAAEGKASLENLAKSYGVHYGTLRNRASQEKWKVEAQKLRDEVLAKSEAVVVPMLVKHRVEVIDKQLQRLGGLREVALDKLQKLLVADKLTPDQVMKVVFDSLRAERQLNEMIGDGLTHGMSEDEKEQAMFQSFVQKFFSDGATEIKNVTPALGHHPAPIMEVLPPAPAPEAVPVKAEEAGDVAGG